MIDRRQLLFHLRATRFDLGVVLATAFAAIFISIEFCIVIGVFLSFVLYIPRAAQVRLIPLTATPGGDLRERQPEDPNDDELLAFELEGELFFGAEVEVARHFDFVTGTARGNTRAILLVLKRGRNPDAGFLSLLQKLHQNLASRGIILILCGVQPDLMMCLGRTRLTGELGTERLFSIEASDKPGGNEAIAFAFKKLRRPYGGP